MFNSITGKAIEWNASIGVYDALLALTLKTVTGLHGSGPPEPPVSSGRWLGVQDWKGQLSERLAAETVIPSHLVSKPMATHSAVGPGWPTSGESHLDTLRKVSVTSPPRPAAQFSRICQPRARTHPSLLTLRHWNRLPDSLTTRHPSSTAQAGVSTPGNGHGICGGSGQHAAARRGGAHSLPPWGGAPGVPAEAPPQSLCSGEQRSSQQPPVGLDRGGACADWRPPLGPRLVALA